MEALLNAQGLWKCTQVLAQDFMTTLGTVTLKEKDEIESKFDKALVVPTCKEIARGRLAAKDVWKTLKDHRHCPLLSAFVVSRLLSDEPPVSLLIGCLFI